MDAARPREREGYVEDVACAVAAVLRRLPFVSAALLVAGIAVTTTNWFWLDPALFRAWITSAAFLAGAALATRSTAAQLRWSVGVSGVAVAMVVVAADVVLFRASSADDGVTTTIKLLAFLGLTFLIGFGLRDRIAVACAAAFAALTLVPGMLSAAAGGEFPTEPREPALYAGWAALLLMLLAARRGRWVLALPFAIGLVLWHESVGWDVWGLKNLSTKDHVGFTEIFVTAAASVLLPVVAGRAAAVLARGEDRDGVARLVVRIQRDPWRTALVAVLVATAFVRSTESMSIADLIVVAAAMALLAHCSAGPVHIALAPWAAASVISVPLSFALQARLKDRYFELTVLPEALLVLYVPLVLGAVVAGARTRRWPWWGWAVLAVVLTVEAINLISGVRPDAWCDEAACIWAAAWCLVVSFLFHATATSAVPAWLVLAASPFISLLVNDAFYGATLGWSSIERSRNVASLLAGPAAALLALAARKVRSMTALPADHTSFELSAARAPALVPAPNP